MKKLRSLTALHLYILIAINDKSLHGYGIIKETERLTNCEVRAGSIYNSLRILLRDGLIQDVKKNDNSRRTSYYQVTNLGQGAMQDELQRLDKIICVTRQQGIYEKT